MPCEPGPRCGRGPSEGGVDAGGRGGEAELRAPGLIKVLWRRVTFGNPSYWKHGEVISVCFDLKPTASSRGGAEGCAEHCSLATGDRTQGKGVEL